MQFFASFRLIREFAENMIAFTHSVQNCLQALANRQDNLHQENTRLTQKVIFLEDSIAELKEYHTEFASYNPKNKPN